MLLRRSGWLVGVEFNAPLDTLGPHFGGGLHSQSLDWYCQTKQYRKIQINKLEYKSEKVSNLKYSKTKLPGSAASYNTRPGNDVGLFYNAPEPTRGQSTEGNCSKRKCVDNCWEYFNDLLPFPSHSQRCQTQHNVTAVTNSHSTTM